MEIQPRSDEKRILSNVAVLEGAPPLSEHWQLFNKNIKVLFNEARTAQAATVVFLYAQLVACWPAAFIPCVASGDENPRGKNTASLRATDERLLLGLRCKYGYSVECAICCLTMIEKVRAEV